MFMREVFFSQLQHSRVEDERGRRIGILKDVAISHGSNHPRVVGIRVGGRSYVPIGSIAGGLTGEVLRVSPKTVMCKLRADESYAAEIFMDKQILDCREHRVRLVSDLVFASYGREDVEERCFFAGVDVGLGGIWRRMSAGRFASYGAARVIGWRDIVMLGEDDAPPQLTLSEHRLGGISAEDIIEICRKLDRRQRCCFIRYLPQAVLCRAMVRLSSSERIALLSVLGDEEVKTIIRSLPRGVRKVLDDDARLAWRFGAEGGGDG